MIVTCPNCRRSLSTADAADAPSFCMYCGSKLGSTPDSPTAAGMRTLSFSPTESGVDDDEVPVAPDPSPKVIGGYRLLRLLGSGGMGSVYEAEAPGSSSRVAVKLLSSRLASSTAAVERFKQEGRLASQLAHPRCVFVLAADAEAGRPYIVMELMPGDTLKDVVEKRGPLPADQAITFMLDIIDGLAEAHRVGMIHRDMKPSNCFLTADGRVKVGDFGLSKSLVTRDQHLTRSGAFLGTVLFASPEQIRGEPLDYGSDVYSVCSTLYYLLCGEAPFHHENITAALAKAISEDPPPICERRPGVPRGLGAVVMKGLDRERERRWQTLDDLREALVALLPSRQHPARPRALIGAYALDRIVLAFLLVPVEVLQMWAAGVTEGRIDFFEVRFVNVMMVLVYFTLAEGLLGVTPGKWLLGLRVSRVGQTGPPGLWRGFVRTGVFLLLLTGLFVVPEECVRLLGPAVGGSVGGAAFLLSSVALLAQVRRRWGFRGLHDLASGCHVTQKPLPARKLRLPVKHPTPLSVLLPPPAEPLPATVGGYAVKGRLCAEPDADQVWVGEDRALARAVLIRLRPAKPDAPTVPEAARPTRLRRLGGGTLTWSGTAYDWTAFAAPLGGPLLDAIHPSRPLPWADGRFILEQLVEEFRAADADGTTPERFGLDQVWVEPNGRVQYLECTLCGAGTPAAGSALALLREVASLTLEGRPRSHPGPVHAPLPSHAHPVLDRLFSPTGPTLTDLQKDLAETHAHRPEVTPAVRAAQLGIQAAVIAVPLAVMFLLAFALAPYLTLVAGERAAQADAALAAVADPEKRAKLAEFPELKDPLKHPKLEARLEGLRDRKRAEAEFRRSALTGLQLFLLEKVEANLTENAERSGGYPVQAREAIHWAGAPDGTPRAKSAGPWSGGSTPILVVLLVIPVGMAILAAILRGGVSMLLAGIALVRGDGRRASRRQCGLRAAVVWFPVAGLLFGAAALQAFDPQRVYLAAGLWLIAVALLPIYVVVALRLPDRPPQDRVTGTYLVPA